VKVGEVKQFAIDNEREIAPSLDAALERSLDAEVTYKIHNLTTDEIEIYMTFIDSETNGEEFLGIIDGAIAFTLLDEFGIDFPETL
jgi:acyl-coenzyme A thioesterase PaaI-like protein